MELINAIRANNINEVQQCLNAGINIEFEYQTWTPLMWAIHEENPEIVSLLLQYHANIKHRDISSHTPLHLAVDTNNIELVRLLLKNEADPNRSDVIKRTSLAKAMTPEIAELLIQYHACTEHKDYHGNSLLHLSAMDGPEDMIRFFAKYNDINSLNKNGRTPLHLASQYHRTENVKILLELGADPDIIDDKGQTAKDLAYKQEIKELIDSYIFPIKGAIEDDLNY